MNWKIERAVSTDSERLFELLQVIWHDMSFYAYVQLPPKEYRQFMLQQLQSEGTKYSYQNCWVVRDKAGIIQGVLLGYSGDLEPQLDQKLYDDFCQEFPIHANNVEIGALESRSGEWYLDSLVVSPEYRGQGIAQAFLQQLHAFVSAHKIIGLNCDLVNPNAKRLYERIGFQVIDRVTFFGHNYNHMQLAIGG